MDWCRIKNLSLNIDKTKERPWSNHFLMNINRYSMEIVKSNKFLGLHMANLSWSLNTSQETQQCLDFLQRLRKAHLKPTILTTFNRRTIKSILSIIVDDPTYPSHKLFTLLPSWYQGLNSGPHCQTVQQFLHPSHLTSQCSGTGLTTNTLMNTFHDNSTIFALQVCCCLQF